MEKNHDNNVIKNNLPSNTSQNGDKSVTSSSNLLSPDNIFSPATSPLAIEEAQKHDPNFNPNPLLLNNNLTLAEEPSTGAPALDQTFSLHQVQAVVDNTATLNPTDAQIVAQKDAIAFNNGSYEPLIPIKPFQDNFGSFEPNKTYNTLDVANFEAPKSSEVNTFYEAAANAEVAQEFGLKTEIESLTDFDYVDIASTAEASLTPVIDDERRNQTNPNANPDFNTYTEGTSINPTGNVLINDNANGNILTVSNPGTYQGLYGTLILSSDGSYTYIPKDPATNPDVQKALDTPGDDFDVFPYNLDNGNGSTLAIKIIPVDSTPVTPPVVTPPVVIPPVVIPPVTDPTPTIPPQANPDVNSYKEGSNLPVTGNILDNDTRNGSDLTVSDPNTYDKTYGTITINQNGSYTVTPKDFTKVTGTDNPFNNPGPHTDQVPYTAVNADGVTTKSMLTITYTTDPKAQPDVNSYTEGSNTPVTGNVLLENDVKNGGDLKVADPNTYDKTYGSITINQDGSYTVTPKDFSKVTGTDNPFNNPGPHTDEVPYTAVNADGVTTKSMLTITYTTNPQAQPDVNSYTEGSGTPVTGNVLLENDIKNGGDLTVKTPVVNYEGTYGTTTINQDGSYTVTPKDFSNVTGEDNPFNNPGPHTDQVPYTAINKDGVETTSTLTITYGPGAPVAQPNSYEFDANVTYAQSEESLEGSEGLYVTHFDLNIIGDPVDETKPSDTTNPKDSDPQGENITVDRVTDANLTIAGKNIVLTATQGPLPDGVAAQYSFEFQGSTGTFTQNKDGTVDFSTPSQQLFYSVEVGQKVIFTTTYYIVNQQDNIESKVGASLTLTLDGTSLPYAQFDLQTLDDSQLVNTKMPILNIFQNDYSPMDPSGESLRVSKIYLNGEDNSEGPTLVINGVKYTLEITTMGPDSPLHLSTTVNGQNLSFDLEAHGLLSVTNGASAFNIILENSSAALKFEYLLTDGVANATSKTQVIINFTNTGGVLTANTDYNTYLEGSSDAVTGNVLPNDTPNTESNPLKVVDLKNLDAKVQFMKGVYGDLTLNEDGSYVYTPHPVTDIKTQIALNTGSLVDTFTYTAANPAGNTSNAQLIIKVTAPPVVQLAHYANTTQPDGASSVPYKGYDNFNTNSFPLTEETKNISTIIDPNTLKPQDISQYLVNTIKLESSTNHLTVTFDSEGAGYKNSFGWYEIDPKSGTIFNVKLIWDNASADGSGGSLVKGQTADLGHVSKGDQIGFFLIADGYTKNATIDQVMQNVTNGKGFLAFADIDANGDASFAKITSNAPHLFYVSYNGENAIELVSQTGDQNSIYHTAASPENSFALNGDKLQHAAGSFVATSKNTGAAQIGIEDLPEGGDKDYNDLVFKVILPGGATNSEQADSNHINVAFTDIDGKNLTFAMVKLESNEGGINGDNFVLSTFQISSTTDAEGYHKITTQGYDTLSIKGLGTALTANGTVEIDIKGTDTHAHYQDVVNDLHLVNNLTLLNPDLAAGTRYLSVQVYDEDYNSSNIDNIPYIITKLTPVDTTDASGLDGNQYIHVTDPNITGQDIKGNNADNIFEVTAAGNTIHAGSGNDQIISTGGSSEIHLGGGNDTVYTSGGGNKIYADSSNAYINAGTGANDIYLGAGKAVIAFQDADIENSIFDGNNVDTIHNPIIAGSANATVIDLSQILHNIGNYKPGEINKFVEIKEVSDGKVMLEVNATGDHADSKAVAILEGVSGQDSLNVFDGNYHQIIAVTQGG
ncbi:MAG: Ig-like domain-containing protein [Janthinobacterium lividum]